MHLNPTKLSTKVKKLLETSSLGRALASVSIVELGMLIDKGRIKISVPFNDYVRDATVAADIQVIPLDLEIASETARLPGSFHFDPADRIIVATARVRQYPLITADEAIHEYEHVKAVW